MEPVILVKAAIKDVEIIQTIGRRTFEETFGSSNTNADMVQYLNQSFSAEKVLADLQNPESFFFLAKAENNTVGYIKLNINDAQTELQDPDALEIERIYVLKEYQGRKVGQLLYQQALDTARAEGKKYIWLGVWEENKQAIDFYTKNGFVVFDKHIFRLGKDEQTDIMMKKTLENQNASNE